MRRTLQSFSLAGFLALLVPTLAAAQEDPLVFPDRSEVEPGQPYVATIERDWQVRCIRSPEDEIPDRCEMFQLLEEENGNPVAEFRLAMALTDEEGIVATMTLLSPLNTLLSPGLTLAIDDNEPATVPYAFCQEIGCFVQIALSAEDVDVFQNGGDAFITIFALIQNDNGQMGGAPVEVTASLRGFTAAYEDLDERVAEIRAFIAAQGEAASE